MGDQAGLRLPRRWHQRHRRRAGGGPGRQLCLHPDAPRGGGRLHGLRARQVDRRGRNLHGDLGSRRHPPAERALRRQARPPAGRRHRRPAGAHRDGRALPAGSRPDVALQGRRRRVRPHVHDPLADAPPRRPGAAHRQGRAHRHLHHHPERRAGGGLRGARPRARHRAFRHRLCPAAHRAGRGAAAPGGRDPERGQEGRDPGRRRGAGRHRRGDRDRRGAGRRRRQGAARPRRGAGRPALRHRPDRPAGHAAQLGHDDGLRHLPDDRVELSLFRVPAQGGPGARRADRHRPAHGLDPLPDGGQPGRRRGADAARPAAAPASARRIAAGARRWRARSPTGGRARRRAPTSRPTRSTPSCCSGSCPTACRTMPSSRRTAARRPTGSRAA